MLKVIYRHVRSEWYKYIIEVIVVIVGILIAYNLEQWSDARKDKKREIEILKELQGALSADLREMQENIQMHDYSILSSKMILKAIKEDFSYHDSLDACFGYTHAFTVFSGRIGPIEQLKNTNLAIISNDKLRLDIVSMYDEAYPRIRLVELAIRRDYEQLRDFDRLYFEAYDVDRVSTNKSIPTPLWGVMRPINFEELKTKPEYAALLRARISNQTGLLRIHYQPIKRDLQDLIKHIDDEIKKLE